MKTSGVIAAGVLFLFITGGSPSEAATRTWSAASTGDWFTAANWGGDPYPTNGDDVYIQAGTAVLLTNSTAYLSSLTLSKTLIFSNWNTTLSATNVTIQNGGVVTLPPAFTNNAMSNNICIVCSNLTIDAGGSINVDGRGFSCGVTNNDPGHGPGGGAGNAGYGGIGGYTTNTYGSVSAPLDAGSGGRRGSAATAGSGGGAVRIEATGNVTINGVITANGGDNSGSASYCGSGGGIYLTCRTFAGTNGVIQANGGNGINETYGGGGGGRIAVIYSPSAQSNMPWPSVSVSAAGGGRPAMPETNQASIRYEWGDLGTVYFPDKQLVVNILLLDSGELVIPGFTNLDLASLTVSNAWIRLPDPSFQMAVTNDIIINGPYARVEIGGNTQLFSGYHRFRCSEGGKPAVTCGGNLILTNGGDLVVYGGMTNGGQPDYGALVSVTGNVILATANSWICPHSHPTNGGSVLFRMNNLSILTTNCGFDADERGFSTGYSLNAPGYGPGAGEASAGYGGVALGNRNNTYGSVAAPLDPGSGGCCANNGPGRNGGGLIRIEARGQAFVNGCLKANSGPTYGSGAGLGSGGGIYIACNTFAGTNGLLCANGGTCSGNYYGGGGGRIAVTYDMGAQSSAPIPSVTFSAAGGFNSTKHFRNDWGDMGTVYLTDPRFLSEVLPHSGRLIIPGFTNWSVNNLFLSNVVVGFRESGFRLTVTNELRIDGAMARLELGGNCLIQSARRFIYSEPDGPSLTCGSLLLTNGGWLAVYSGPTNGSARYGSLVSVAGSVVVASNSWFEPVSHPTNGGSVLWQVGSLLVNSTNSGIMADQRGYASLTNYALAFGPGGGSGGGSYGGQGGNCSRGTYGASNAPADPGSGGQHGGLPGGPGGDGGGLVWIQAAGTLRMHGLVSANGGGGTSYQPSGGSGGGIYLSCRRFEGSLYGSLCATGGPGGGGSAGGGGGGRIAVWRVHDPCPGVVSTCVNGGSAAYSGQVGTIVWGWLREPGTVFVVH